MKTIIYIEDTRANRILVDRVLESEGYRILTAPDGETGIRLAMSESPDLILIDMGLPDIDGQTVVTLLQRMPNLQNIPIVALTAWPADTAYQLTERYGLAGCILKPIDVKRFPQQIAAYLEETTTSSNSK
jgi:two-component system cell cycle response regulator DivK